MENLSNNLFLLIANLSQKKDKSSIIKLFIQGLNSFIPHVFFTWSDEVRKNALIEVSTHKKIYGEVVFSDNELEQDQVAIATIQNAAQMLAVIIERLEQQQMLSNEKEYLEQIVDERTSDLVEKVQEYESLYEEYRDLNGKLHKSIKEVEKSEEKFRIILESSTNIFFRHDINHKLTYVSPQVKEILGFEPEEAMVQWTNLTTENPLNIEGFNLTVEAIRTGKVQRPYELELRHKSGRNVIVEVREAPVVKDGKTVAVVGVLVDITDRKLAQEKLLKNRYYLKKAQEMGHIGTWELDIEEDVLVWTDEIYRIFEVPKGTELNFDKFISWVHSDDRNLIQEQWNNALKGKVYDVEHRIFVNDKVKWVKQKAYLEFNNTKPVKAIGFTQDITERKLAEAKLHESNARYRLLYQSAGIGVGYYSCEGKVIEMNEIALNQFNAKDGEVQGKTVYDLFPQEKADLYMKRIRYTLEADHAIEFEDDVQLGTEKKWFLSSYSKVKDIKGNITGVQIMSMEVTNLKQVQRDLRESEERFKSYIEHAPEGIFLMNPNGDFLEVNSEACSMTGYKKDELLEMNLMKLTPDEYHNKVAENLMTLKHNRIMRTELPFFTREGKKRYWSIDAVGLSDDLYLAFKRDVTAKQESNEQIRIQNEKLEKSLRKLEQTTQELKVAKEMAEESDRLKTAFLANMSHEIRTPMNGILGFVDLLMQADVEGGKKDRFLQMIRKSGERLLYTINDIIEISKIESGQIFTSYSDESLKEIMHFIYNFFKTEAMQKGLEMIMDKDFPDIAIRTDRNKLESILSNLIKNALKFTSVGSISFGCRRKSDQIEFYVRDTGIGIPRNRSKAIFDRFVQADIEISRPYEGSGLGLAIAKAYTEMLGGDIWFNSEVGEGSTFFFTVRYEPSHAFTKESFTGLNEEQIIPAFAKSKTILIAEDDKTSVDLLEMYFESTEFNLIHAKNGLEAVEILRNNPSIDLVLMDIKMPLMDGLEATRHIRQFNKEVPVIAQTAFAFPEDAVRVKNAGCNDYIPKPVLKDALMAKINKQLHLENS